MAARRAYNCNSGFSDSYMLLKPEEVKFLDLWRLLFSSNLKKRRFLDSSRAREYNFWHRFFIFLSIVVLKLLGFLANPLALFGFYLESSLNVLSANHGFRGILLNILRCNSPSGFVFHLKSLFSYKPNFFFLCFMQ